MSKKCPFLVKHKRNNAFGVIHKCMLADTLLRSKDLREKWACGGCSVPKTLGNKPCKYLKPCKNFLIRGSSITWFICDLFNIALNEPTEFCTLHCKAYEKA